MDIIMCNEEQILQKLSYKEIIENTKSLEVFFQQHIPEKSYISIYMMHNVHIPSLILSMKRCGHIFVPINMNALDQEIEELVEYANIQYLISLKNNSKSIKNFEILNSIVLGSDEIILWTNNVEKKPCVIDKALICILPTSGTTGKRKLVKIESYCIEQNIESLSKIFNLVEDDVIYYGTPLSFDPSLVELFLALQSKATLLIVPEYVKLNPHRLFRTLFSGNNNNYPKVTFLQIIPSLFTRWTDKQIEYILKRSHLKMLVLGGEPFPLKILKFERSIKLFNIYGITEISCWATIHEVDNNNTIYLGAPLEETSLKIFEKGEEIQEGIGELYIGSKTRHCFINEESQRVEWRATGDLVQKSCEGIEYLGRKDNRIKRFGYQIFLSEVEKKIFDKIGLASKCIWLEKDSKLLLFIVIPLFELNNISKILDKLRVKLIHLLPKQEFPDFMDIIPMFPVNQNGKLDRLTLIEIYERSKHQQDSKDASTVFSMVIAKYLGHSLKNFDKIKKFTFEELGGNSILYTLITNELKDTLKYEIPSEFLSLLFNESIENCFNYLDDFQDWNNKTDDSEFEEIEPHVKRTKYETNVDVVWKFNLLGCVDATPLLFEKCGKTYVGVGSFSNFFVILDAQTGNKIFLEQFPDSIENEASVSPCLNFLYFGCLNGNLYCISLEDYKIAWSYQAGNSIKCKPCYCLSNRAVVFGSYDKHIHCIESENGEIIWKTYIGESIVTTPIHHQEKEQILLTTLSGSCVSISEKTGGILWRIKLENPIFSSSHLIDNNLISCDVLGNLYCTDINTGNIISKINVEGEIFTSIKYKNGYLIIGSSKGILYKCKLIDNNTECNVVKSLNLKNSISSTPTIFETVKKLFVAVFTSDGRLHLIHFQTFEIVFHWKCPGIIYSSCVFSQNKLFVGCRDDNMYCWNITIV